MPAVVGLAVWLLLEASLGPKGASSAIWVSHSALLSRSNRKQHTLQMYRILVESLHNTCINGTAVCILPEMGSSVQYPEETFHVWHTANVEQLLPCTGQTNVAPNIQSSTRAQFMFSQ